jgi:TldD protein
MPKVDSDFTSLNLDGCADAALQTAKDAGADVAEFRLERIRTQAARTRNDGVEGTADDTTTGMGVRVIVDGSFGFAGCVATDPDSAARTAQRAVEIARAFAKLNEEPIELADEPVASAEWCSEYEIDPFTIPVDDKVNWLISLNKQLLDAGVSVASSFAHCVKEQKFFASLAGSRFVQQRIRMQSDVSATQVDPGGEFEQMETSAPPVGRGWEWIGKQGWDYESKVAQLAEHVQEKLKAPSVEPGRYDLVIDPTNLWLTIHESIGHSTELDRVLGYEANYAGTSFATLENLNRLQFGSSIMNVTGDRVTPNGLSTVAFDDEGVEAQQWDIIKDGVLVGYQLSRHMAKKLDMGRSNGCAFADSPLHVPVQRMPNVSLRPASEQVTLEDLIGGVENGIYIYGDNSWSIDMQRYNFQFTGQRFYRIRNGKLDGMLRDVAYQARTTDFWNSMDAIGGASTYLLGGAFNCGKAQPGQIAPVTHGAPSGGRTMRPEQLVEALLAAATSDAVVRVDSASVLNLRWANSTTTTNGTTSASDLSIGAIVDGKVGSLSLTLTGSEDPAALMQAAEQAARTQPASPDAMPLVSSDEPAPNDWDADPAQADPGLFTELVGGLDKMFASSRTQDHPTYGYAEHTEATVWLGTTSGVRKRATVGAGSFCFTTKDPTKTRSAWEGEWVQDWAQIDPGGSYESMRGRLDVAKERVEMPAGRYDVILTPSCVADLFTYFTWLASLRDAQDGRTAFSKKGGGTRLGEQLTQAKFTLSSDPTHPGLQSIPFEATTAGADANASIFDAGLDVNRYDVVRDGKLVNLIATRAIAERSGVERIPAPRNLLIAGDGKTLDEMIAGTEKALLLNALWYIRLVDPASMLLTGLTRDGVYLVEDGRLRASVNNFRWNVSPVDLLADIQEIGRAQVTLPREFESVRAAAPPLRVANWNMSSVSEAS